MLKKQHDCEAYHKRTKLSLGWKMMLEFDLLFYYCVYMSL